MNSPEFGQPSFKTIQAGGQHCEFHSALHEERLSVIYPEFCFIAGPLVLVLEREETFFSISFLQAIHAL